MKLVAKVFPKTNYASQLWISMVDQSGTRTQLGQTPYPPEIIMPYFRIAGAVCGYQYANAWTLLRQALRPERDQIIEFLAPPVLLKEEVNNSADTAQADGHDLLV